ncbi:hypothetical protein TWF281_003741 [Arthrobotrys megalospora]
MDISIPEVIAEYSLQHGKRPDLVIIGRRDNDCRIEVHRDVVSRYSVFFARALPRVPQRTRNPEKRLAEITVPCASTGSFYTAIGWMYYKEMRQTFPWPETRPQLANWPASLGIYEAADNLGMERLTVELNEQLNKSLGHHARVLPFKEATEQGIDTSPATICKYINEVYKYNGRIKLHGLIHVMLATRDGREVEDIVNSIRNSKSSNAKFVKLIEYAADEIGFMARERCSCLWIDRHVRRS